MHDLLFENQPHLKLHQLRSYAERLDVDLARYAVEMEHHVYLQRIREHRRIRRHREGSSDHPTCAFLQSAVVPGSGILFLP